MTIFYPVKFEAISEDINGSYYIKFRDFPEYQTSGKSLLDAIHKASDKLKEIVDIYDTRGLELPIPSDRLDDELNITVGV